RSWSVCGGTGLRSRRRVGGWSWSTVCRDRTTARSTSGCCATATASGPRTERPTFTLDAVQALLTETAGRLLDEGSERGGRAIEEVRMQRDGRLTIGGSAVDADAVRPEVACATGDIFFRGGAASWFDILLRTTSLQWFQSPAAGYIALYDRLFEHGMRITGAHVNAIPIAEYVIQALLAHFQRADEWAVARADHEWRPHEFREVFATTWLVGGGGALGS